MSYQHQHPPGASQGYQTVPNEHTTIYLGQPDHSLFNTKKIRSQFVSKVLSILFVQLLFASVLIAVFQFHQPTRTYFLQHGQFWLYGALGLGMVVYFILVCVESARRSFPTNLILLGLLTLAYGFIAAILASRYDQTAVLSAFIATTASVLVVVLLAKFSPFDITTCGCALCVLGLVHLITSLILILVLVPAGYANTAALIVAGGGAFLVSLYLMFDLQLIMGGRSMELSPEEYILGAALLYIDILSLFQYMLILFGRD